MVGNEGTTRIRIYTAYGNAGFDPDKDMLQANVVPPDCLTGSQDLPVPRQWRYEMGLGGVLVDWDLKSSLEGLYAAGDQVACGSDHATSSTTGRYAGRKATEYAKAAGEPVIDRKQVEAEKTRVYAPVMRQSGVGWKELRAGLCRIMQDYCGESRSEEVLKMGLRWLNSIRESEASMAYARNPHELARTLENFTHLTVSEIVMHASLARQASSMELEFKRIDYPKMDPPEWQKYITLRQEKGEVKVGERPLKYWLLPPNAPTYEENYNKHCGL
jgi:succinate dehydrogenase/fumarate reductase flavoprotein subunit